MCGVVYKITSKLNGRSYVGKTTRSIEERFGEHARRKKFLIEIFWIAELKHLLSEIDAHKLTYSALAEILGISVTTVSQKLRRERNFTERDRVKLVEFFGKPADYLLKCNF